MIKYIKLIMIVFIIIIASSVFAQTDIEDDLCNPQSNNCGLVWRHLTDTGMFFAYDSFSDILYQVSSNSNVAQYDLSQYIDFDAFYDFIPYSPNKIVFLNTGLLNNLQVYDLATNTSISYLDDYIILPCAGDPFHPNVQYFMREGTTSRFLFCGQDKTDDGRYIATIDIETGEVIIHNRIAFYRPQRNLQPWYQVVIGHDGNIYAQFLLAHLINTSELENVLFHQLNPNTNQWQPISLETSTHTFGRIVGVDQRGYVYGVTDAQSNRTLMSTLTVINPTGEVAASYTANDLGINPRFLGVHSNGEIVVINQPDLSTTSGITFTTIPAYISNGDIVITVTNDTNLDGVFDSNDIPISTVNVEILTGDLSPLSPVVEAQRYVSRVLRQLGKKD